MHMRDIISQNPINQSIQTLVKLYMEAGQTILKQWNIKQYHDNQSLYFSNIVTFISEIFLL